MENGVMKMLPAGELEIAAGGTLTFAPGGYHVMCMKPAADIKSRDSVPVTLKFRNGETLEAMFSV
ncbi:MAG TPA: copper chaperone PCu(A)C, partial [Rhodobacteraceae bacterium]|nr:copper chaperone PCu(A)C [Paracoccaceae bacterium]